MGDTPHLRHTGLSLLRLGGHISCEVFVHGNLRFCYPVNYLPSWLTLTTTSWYRLSGYFTRPLRNIVCAPIYKLLFMRSSRED